MRCWLEYKTNLRVFKDCFRKQNVHLETYKNPFYLSLLIFPYNFHRRQLKKLSFCVKWKIEKNLEVVFIMEKNWIDWTALVLVIIGGLNWGVYAFGYNDIVDILLGGIPALAKTFYALIALAALYVIYFAVRE